MDDIVRRSATKASEPSCIEQDIITMLGIRSQTHPTTSWLSSRPPTIMLHMQTIAAGIMHTFFYCVWLANIIPGDNNRQDPYKSGAEIVQASLACASAHATLIVDVPC